MLSAASGSMGLAAAFRQRFDALQQELRTSLEGERVLLDRISALTDALATRSAALELAFAHSQEDARNLSRMTSALLDAEEARDAAELREREARRVAGVSADEAAGLRAQLMKAHARIAGAAAEAAEERTRAASGGATWLHSSGASGSAPTVSPFEKWKQDGHLGFAPSPERLRTHALSARHVHSLGHEAAGDIVVLLRGAGAAIGEGKREKCTTDCGAKSRIGDGQLAVPSGNKGWSHACDGPGSRLNAGRGEHREEEWHQQWQGQRATTVGGGSDNRRTSGWSGVRVLPTVTNADGRDKRHAGALAASPHGSVGSAGVDAAALSEEYLRLQRTLARLDGRDARLHSLRSGAKGGTY
jgi:hypothetical protein